jgi:adenylate cyclase
VTGGAQAPGNDARAAAAPRLAGSLAAKWTLAIALLLVLGMGLLGAYLIGQQERAFERYSSRLGELLADQLARSASEPLMADDAFQLELLVRRQLDQDLVIGAAVLGHDGAQRASAGFVPVGAQRLAGNMDDGETVVRMSSSERAASTYVRPVTFQDVHAGHVLLSLNRSPLERDRRVLVNALVATTVLLIVFVGLLAVPLARWMSSPIRRLADWEPDGDTVMEARRHGVREPADELTLLAERLQRLSIDAAAKRQIEAALNRYLSPGVARSVLAAPEHRRLEAQAVRGSVLFCDIVDFTRLARQRPPQELAALVNDYFGAFAMAGALCHGTVDKFIGDSVMILFGVPDADPEHALNAVVCGQAIVRLAEAINVRRAALGLPTVSFRVAVNSGEMQAGNLGSLERMEFTVLGDTVNLASRLCARTPADRLVVSSATLAETGEVAAMQTEPLGPLRLKGYDEPVTAYAVTGLDDATEARVADCLAAVNEATPA